MDVMIHDTYVMISPSAVVTAGVVGVMLMFFVIRYLSS